MRINISELYALADKIENLEESIYSLSDNAVGASNSVIERSKDTESETLTFACTKALKSAGLVREMAEKVCSQLSYQKEVLREAALTYRENDRIDRIN